MMEFATVTLYILKKISQENIYQIFRFISSGLSATCINFLAYNSFYLIFKNLANNSGILFFILEFQWFLIALSVRPGRNEVISAHLFPN